jgi:hypothetical protein
MRPPVRPKPEPHEVTTMSNEDEFPDAPICGAGISAPARPSRLTSWLVGALLLGAGIGVPWWSDQAFSAPSPTDQSLPSLADTPGPATSLAEPELRDTRLKFVGGEAVLDSAVVLKAYVQAWSGQPSDDSAILTPNTDDITPPPPVQPNAAQRAAIDRLLRAVRAHPNVLIRADDVALEPRAKGESDYAMDNRLFLDGAKYYFDNSPYHFIYRDAQPFVKLHCGDPRTAATIDAAIVGYRHFSMDIEGRVVGVSGKGLEIQPRRITLRDGTGAVVLTQGGDAVP